MRVFLGPPDRALRLARDPIAVALPAVPVMVAHDDDRLILRPERVRHAGIAYCHHIQIKRRSNVSIVSSARDVGKRNDVTVVRGLQPIGPL